MDCGPPSDCSVFSFLFLNFDQNSKYDFYTGQNSAAAESSNANEPRAEQNLPNNQSAICQKDDQQIINSILGPLIILLGGSLGN